MVLYVTSTSVNGNGVPLQNKVAITVKDDESIDAAASEQARLVSEIHQKLCDYEMFIHNHGKYYKLTQEVS